ncbi:hypothetical protein ACLOJK_004725 [Asimina triloba]
MERNSAWSSSSRLFKVLMPHARVGVVPGWVNEQEVLSTTPLRSIEARGNGERRPVGVGPVGLPLCRNKAVMVGWVDVGGAEAWVSYQSIGTQSGQYLSSDPGWLGLACLRMKNLGDFFVESGTSAVMVDGDASGSESCGSSSIFRILHFEWTASFLVRRAIGSVVGGNWGVGSGAG